MYCAFNSVWTFQKPEGSLSIPHPISKQYAAKLSFQYPCMFGCDKYSLWPLTDVKANAQGNWTCCDGYRLFYRASQHIDWLEDTSESWYMTLTKSAPLGEECVGFWDPTRDKSHKTKTEIVNKPECDKRLAGSSAQLLSRACQFLPLGSLHSIKHTYSPNERFWRAILGWGLQEHVGLLSTKSVRNSAGKALTSLHQPVRDLTDLLSPLIASQRSFSGLCLLNKVAVDALS